MACATTANKLMHVVCKPTRRANIVPMLVGSSLLSTPTFVEAGYTAIYNKNKLNFYDPQTTKIMVLADPVLTSWCCPHANLWCVPLVLHVSNINTDTLLLNHPSGQDSLHAMNTVRSTKNSCAHLAFHMCPKFCQDYLHNVYELPSIEPTIQYLHGAMAFPPKATWLHVVCWGNFLLWPLMNVKNVGKFFPESKESQKGHMRGQQQHARSTKEVEPTDNLPTDIPHEKECDIFVTSYETNATMYTNQTRAFPSMWHCPEASNSQQSSISSVHCSHQGLQHNIPTCSPQ
jgi:hypothetical protein